MKRKLNQKLLVTTGAIAGLAIGASMALAAHTTPIPLYTYEEVATQFGQGTRMQVYVDPVTKQGMPYSPKQTCGTTGCHNYADISDHAYHSAQGRNQFQDYSSASGVKTNGGFSINNPINKAKPWSQSGAMFGKW